MALSKIAEMIDNTVELAEDVASMNRAVFVESDARKMAHHVVAYVLERAVEGQDPKQLGRTMLRGAILGEDESGGPLVDPVIDFLSGLLEGAVEAKQEAHSGDEDEDESESDQESESDDVDTIVRYFKAHGKFPESARPEDLRKAKAKLLKGR
ncbi:hypothetical protein D6783_03825 [Candidatus Woesearchaeota archaeon]|nr:MAG: hypothetical protein D6783_03825 [Candidatus Woesearchaeota archaeon]